MEFKETPLKGAFLIDLTPKRDERGLFARSFCAEEFEAQGISCEYPQCNITLTLNAGTIRGLHYQLPPHEEDKLIRCVRGKIFDVIVDIRTYSKTYGQWFSVVLEEGDYQMLYVPKGFAHGFQSLKNNTEVLYQMSHPYHAESASGILWNSPDLNIPWPEIETEISIKDESWPSFIALKRKAS